MSAAEVGYRTAGAAAINKRDAAGGFTLIELMVVVAVIAILASIALPSYQESVRKSRRAQAKADLVEYAQLAERFRTVNNRYAGFALPVVVSPRESGATARYNLTFTPGPGQATFILEATPAPGGGQEADRCHTLSINQAGKKEARGGVAQSNECW
jgi:type IV pilus assembly protein PilE